MKESQPYWTYAFCYTLAGVLVIGGFTTLGFGASYLQGGVCKSDMYRKMLEKDANPEGIKAVKERLEADEMEQRLQPEPPVPGAPLILGGLGCFLCGGITFWLTLYKHVFA